MFSFHDLTKFNDSYVKPNTSVIIQCAGWKKESFFQFKQYFQSTFALRAQSGHIGRAYVESQNSITADIQTLKKEKKIVK